MNPKYDKARFKNVELPPEGPPKSFAVITACDPMGEPISPEENTTRTKTFKKQLDGLGFTNFPVTGYDRETDHAEPGFGINCSFETAIKLGIEHQQDAIFYVNDDELILAYCDQARSKTALGSWRDRID